MDGFVLAALGIGVGCEKLIGQGRPFHTLHFFWYTHVRGKLHITCQQHLMEPNVLFRLAKCPSEGLIYVQESPRQKGIGGS